MTRLLRMPIARLTALGLTTLAISGCETVGGLGEDIEQGGESLSTAAEQTEDEIQEDM